MSYPDLRKLMTTLHLNAMINNTDCIEDVVVQQCNVLCSGKKCRERENTYFYLLNILFRLAEQGRVEVSGGCWDEVCCTERERLYWAALYRRGLV